MAIFGMFQVHLLLALSLAMDEKVNQLIMWMKTILSIIFDIVHAAVLLLNTSNNDGVGLTLLRNIQCVGNEKRVIDCPFDEIGSNGCVVGGTASVRCTGTYIHCICLKYLFSLGCV